MFSGVGGFELGIQNAMEKWRCGQKETKVEESKSLSVGKSDIRQYANCVGYSEIDKYAIEVYEKHFPGVKNYGDAKSIKPEELPDFEMLCGGFPCQAFSIAGKRQGFNDTRGTLFFDIARIVAVKRPKILFLENVKGLLNHEKGETFRIILQTLDELGYDVQWQVLNSKNFGVPQNRERVFIIGSIRGEPRPEVFPFGETIRETNFKDKCMIDVYNKKFRDECPTLTDPCHNSIRVKHIVGKVKVRKHKADIDKLKTTLREAKNKSCAEISEILNIPKTKVEHWFRADNSFAIPDADIWYKLKELINIQTDEFDAFITEFEIRDNKFDQANRVYDKEGIAPTLTTLTGGHQQSAIDVGYCIRKLTPLECERLQGFPDGWTEGLSDTQRYKTMGNAVTVNVIQAIAERLL